MAYWLFWFGGYIGPERKFPLWTLPRLCGPLGHPTAKAELEASLFSAKTFAAAMLAYYIALRIGLPRPSWAIVTVYLVSQPSAGASLSRGLYRLAGTLAGSVATVAIVPTFVNEPAVCSIVLAGWIGLCLFLSLLDRTPRAYAFVLAGYTASLIGFPSVTEPGAMFDTASVRVQEIALGILCSVLVHRYVLPRTMTGQFKSKLSATLQDARQFADDALRELPEERRRADRHRLALDLLVLRGLTTHLPYDPVATTPGSAAVRLLYDRLSRLLPLLADIEERIDAISVQRQGVPTELAKLLSDVRCWIASNKQAKREADALSLISQARALARGGAAAVTDNLEANISGHLAELVGLLHDGHRLQQVAAAGLSRHDVLPLVGDVRPTGYVFHRDPMMAARAAGGAFIGLVLGCIAWICSAWPDGGLAVSVLGVTCALFGNVDAPVPNVRRYLVGSIYGVAISLAYSFVVLPRVFDFQTLVAVLAPTFLFAGSLQARPATTFMALGITLTIPILVGLGTEYGGNFSDAVNSSIALFVGVGFGAVSMTLLQTTAPEVAIDRLLRLAQRDVARRARGSGPAKTAWTGLMIDRAALLLPRLHLSARSTTETLDMTMRHLRIGHAAGLLRDWLGQRSGAKAEATRVLLMDLAAHFESGAPSVGALSDRVEKMIAGIASEGAEHALRDQLIDLRFALAPVDAWQVVA